MDDSASFWADIKNLEEQLVNSPDSFCFARLSDIYRKVGMVDDALYVARRGVSKHPRFIAGQKALAHACHAKGLHNEALAALRFVTEALPEDVASQKLLGQLCVEAGDQDGAFGAFRTALEFYPDDVECRIELTALVRSSGRADGVVLPYDDSDEIIEDIEILEDIEIIEEDGPVPVFECQANNPDSTGEKLAAVPHHDPLSTSTLAELYVSQGFIQKALDIYRAMLIENPTHEAAVKRMNELEALESGQVEDGEYGDDLSGDEAVEEFVAPVLPATPLQAPPVFAQDSADDPLLDSRQNRSVVLPFENGFPAPVLPLKGIADNALSQLDAWLENIRRIKSCRSEMH
jgi:tetratricopeptide (TPR) repeat protein